MKSVTESGLAPKFPAKVVEVTDEYNVVINRGSAHDIVNGQRFLLYDLSQEEIIDPETKESLGFLEIVKGTGRITHVQEKMAILTSDRTIPNEKKVIRTTYKDSPSSVASALESIFSQHGTTIVEEETSGTPEIAPFKNPYVGDRAKPI